VDEMDGEGLRVVLAANTSWYVYNFRLSLIKALWARGFSVGVVAPCDAHASKLEAMGCSYATIPIYNKSTNPFTEIKTIAAYYRTYAAIRPSLILHFTPKPNIYGSLAARALRIPCINNIAGLGTAFMQPGVLSLIVKNLYRLSQRSAFRVFFQNKDDQKLFLRSRIVRADQALLLPGSGVDLRKFQAMPGQERDRVRFLLIARLIRDKGIVEFAEAARLVKKTYPDADFQLVGYVDQGNPGAVSEARLHEWEQQGLLSWLGRQEDVRPCIAQADCIVLPSYYREGTPRTLLEGAAMGRPLIAADSIGCREPVEDGVTGLLCRPKDARDLAAKMERIIDMGHEGRMEMGRLGREKMEREYDERIVIDRYMGVVGGLVGESVGR